MSSRIGNGPGPNQMQYAWQTEQFGLTPGVAESAGVTAALAELYALAPNLDPAVQQFLAAQGVPPPSVQYDGRQDGVLNLLNAAQLLGAEMPVENFLSPAEVAANLDEMFGPGTAALAARTQVSFMRAEAALLAALQGGSAEEIGRILGPDNPATAALTQSIQQLARALMQSPPDLQEITRLCMAADAQLIDYVGPRSEREREQLNNLFREEYGVDPGAAQQGAAGGRRYAGGGAFGNQVKDSGAAEVPAGEFKASSSSQAGLKALEAAKSQIGVREASGNNDGLPSQRYAGGRQEPWCADFVSWCFRQTGQPLPGNQRSLASTSYMENQMKNQGKYFARSQGAPKPGDIIFFGDPGTCHVGIVERVANGKVYTVEGNTSNQVARRSYDLNSSRIRGYGRP
ncbi:MAG: CHAP domain-containing protein [Deltaproteobacteria bacterium]|nr:CHAP domain-containing protein [Deltaproteobacteria bacterium]